MWALLRGATVGTLAYVGAKALVRKARRHVRPNRIYTETELARLLRVPVEEAARLVESGKIAGQRLGDGYRVLGEAVTQFLNARAVVRGAPAFPHA